MDEQLKAKLVSYLDGLEKSAGKVQDFAAAEIPETIREWLMWQMVEGFWMAAAGLLGFLIAGLFLRWAYKIGRKKEVSDGEVGFGIGGGVICFFLVIVSGHGVAIGTQQGLKAAVAPRVVILEKVSELVKGQK